MSTTKESSDLHVTHVACGLRHSVIATKHGCVLTCGASRRGQLGFGTDSATSPAKKQSRSLRCDHGGKGGGGGGGGGKWYRFKCALSIRKMDVERSGPASSHQELVIGDWQIVTVFAGSYHSGVALSQTKDAKGSSDGSSHLLLWGCNKYGQLGRDPNRISSSHSPVRISLVVTKDEIVEVASGWTHLLVRTSAGSVYRYEILGSSGKENIHASYLTFPFASL